MKTTKITTKEYRDIASQMLNEINDNSTDKRSFVETVRGQIEREGLYVYYAVICHYANLLKPDAMDNNELIDVQASWIECHTYDENDNETVNDFDWNELKKYLL